jgi:hypothetical protein
LYSDPVESMPTSPVPKVHTLEELPTAVMPVPGDEDEATVRLPVAVQDGLPARAATPTKAAAARTPPGRRMAILLLCLILLLNLLGIGGVWAYRVASTGKMVSADLSARLARVEALLASPSLSQSSLLQLQSEAEGAEADLKQLDELLPLGGNLNVGPIVPAHRVLQLGIHAMEVAQNAAAAAIVLEPPLQALLYSMTHEKMTSLPPGAHLLTTTDVHQAQFYLDNAKAAWQQVLTDRAAITPSDLRTLQMDQVTRFVQRLDAGAANITHGMDIASAMLDWSPFALGLQGPVHYLLLNMDTDELRATGGFLGNYADLEVKGGALVSGIHFHDVYTLDCPNNACPDRSVPSQYSWFTLAGSQFGMRDANLDPDFPTSAGLVAQLYQKESGQRVEGVIAVTPAIVESVLRVIGQITVPVFNVQVTADNLRSKLHYYHQNAQIATSLGISPTKLGTSIFKVFDVLLAQALSAKLGKMTSEQQLALGKSLLQQFATKDIQVFFNNTRLQQFAQQLDLSGSVATAPGDSLYVVDTNDGASYANSDMVESVSDAVTLDEHGNARHDLTVKYTYTVVQHQYTQKSEYKDLVRVILPAGAVQRNVSGPCDPRSVKQSGHAVIACQFTLNRGSSATFHFSWLVPNASGKQGSSYTLLVQRQPGAKVSYKITVTPPPGRPFSTAASPAQLALGKLTWEASPLLRDTVLEASYTHS